MLTYKAMYKFVENGVHGEVMDFPGAMTCAKDLNAARRLLAGALIDMVETSVMVGENLPVPNPDVTDAEADLEEPIHLILNASSNYSVVPELIHEAA
jgi:predicted RNase H-like HicB family nuclease